MDGHTCLFKVILIGSTGVGKTSLIERYTSGCFIHNPLATIGVDFRIKTVAIGAETIKLQIWDPSGQERFRTVVQSYYRNAHAVVFVYDVTHFRSYERLPDWIEEIERFCSGETLKVLVGNKADRAIEREVPASTAQNFAMTNGFEIFVETSAADATNVDVLFQQITGKLYDQVKTEKTRYWPFHGEEGATQAVLPAHLGKKSRAQKACCHS